MLTRVLATYVHNYPLLTSRSSINHETLSTFKCIKEAMEDDRTTVKDVVGLNFMNDSQFY